jgi:NADH-quinone oxidoreductase subunit E
MSFAFREEHLETIERLRGRFPQPQALVVPLLWLAQTQEGWLKPEVFETVADLSGTAPMEVYRVATFYTMFHFAPVGTHHIQVCKTLSCKLCGKDAILEALKAKLGIDVGETTEDGRFTLSEVECLGSCGTAPMMQINDRNYENLSVETLEAILEALP